ncbi:1771_t:CDS:2 [Paraglomus brasilianum]|uniref:RNA-dependent RNA polymerase n=1 Tax=Paraglomus brasilianum TaxID=144538 RepID=A0A9N8WFD0_9GLOM|nr:1771_t:CDS:2 [Paraglomus brasilianum]
MEYHPSVEHWSFSFNYEAKCRFCMSEPFITHEHKRHLQHLAEINVEYLATVAKRLLGNLKEANGRSVDSLQKETSMELKKALDITSRTTTTPTTTATNTDVAFRNTSSRGRRLFVPQQLSPGTLDLVTRLSINDNKSDDERTFWLTPPSNSISEELSWLAKLPVGCRLTTDYSNYMPTGIPAYVLKKLKKFNFVEQFEICRFFHPFGLLDWKDFDPDVLRACAGNELYDVLKHMYIERGYGTELDSYAIPRRGFSRVWTLMEGGVNVDQGIVFLAKLTLSNSRYLISLDPIKVGRSKRFYRKFGSERFLLVRLSESISGISVKVLEKLKRQLLRPIDLLGRKYEMFYGKDGTFYYFATSGPGLERKPLWDIINWHIPVSYQDINMTFNKFFSRISLGLSNTRSTIVFKPDEIRLVDDQYAIGRNNKKFCMTDGCAAISLGAMKKIADMLNETVTPCAMQGRIGGAKGLWYIDPMMDSSGNWIQIRKSQLKYWIYGKDEKLLKERADDELLRTLDVCKVFQAPRIPGSLNSQFIPVLAYGGVNVNVFTEILKENIEKLKSAVINCNDPIKLIKWLEDTGNLMKMRLDESNYGPSCGTIADTSSDYMSDDIPTISAMPMNNGEIAIDMLAAGFTPKECPFLARKITQFLKNAVKTMTRKFRIIVPLSRVVCCIADPTNTLGPEEVFLQLDGNAGRDEKSGCPFGVIEADMLLARNPAYLPSDAWKVRAVRKAELLGYRNVVVFPTRLGPTDEGSIANRLSGGDYDGDTIFCCWDPRIVNDFHNTQVHQIRPEVEEAFCKNDKKVVDILKDIRDTKSAERIIQQKIVDTLFEDITNQLGLYSFYHQIWSAKFGIDHEKSIYFGQMCAKLVDATKQGLKLKEGKTQADGREVSKLDWPQWFVDQREKKRGYNSLDLLDNPDASSIRRSGSQSPLDIVNEYMKKELSIFNSNNFTIISHTTNDQDQHIGRFWQKEIERAGMMKKLGDSNYLEDLQLIRKSMDNLVNEFNRTYRDAMDEEKERENIIRQKSHRKRAVMSPCSPFPDNKMADIDELFLYKFRTTPTPSMYKNLHLRCTERRSVYNAALDLEMKLKACALYLASFRKKDDGKCCWALAFRELCNIKASMVEADESIGYPKMTGGARAVMGSVWKTMKVDRRWLIRSGN